MLPPSSLAPGRLPPDDNVSGKLFFALFCRRRNSQNASAAITMSPPTPTPTPMPMLAPVDRPLDSVPVSVSEVVGSAGPVCVGVALLPGEVSDDVVVVAETKRLSSEACSWIWMGCAHIVTGPMTCVLSDSTWRTVTMVDDELGRLLIHPANVELPLSSS